MLFVPFLSMRRPRLRSQSFLVKGWDLNLCFRTHTISVPLLLKNVNILKFLTHIAKLLSESIGSMSSSWKLLIPQCSGKQI